MKFYTPIVGSTIILALSAAPMFAMADSDKGLNLGLGIARSDVKFNDIDTGDGNSFDESESQLALRIGYMFTDGLGIDLTGISLTSTSNSGFDATAAIFGLSFVANATLTDKFDLYGKVGAARIRTEVDTPLNVTVENSSSTELFFGLGVELDFGGSNIYLEYNRFDTSEADLNTLILGYKYEFSD